MGALSVHVAGEIQGEEVWYLLRLLPQLACLQQELGGSLVVWMRADSSALLATESGGAAAMEKT